MFGICVGLIILVKEIVGLDNFYLGLLNVVVECNLFGWQVDSFEVDLIIKGLNEFFIGVFICVLYILEVGENVEVFLEYNGCIVVVKQD